MARQKEPFTVRKDSKSPFYYYKIEGGSYRSTGKKSKAEALRFAQRQWEKSQTLVSEDIQTKDWVSRFFVPETCPHMETIGRSDISDRYLENSIRAKSRILEDKELMNMNLQEVRRGDLISFRSRMLKKWGHRRRTEQIMSAIKIIFRQAYFREITDRDPSQGIPKIVVSKDFLKPEKGTFTLEEVDKLFSKEPLNKISRHRVEIKISAIRKKVYSCKQSIRQSFDPVLISQKKKEIRELEEKISELESSIEISPWPDHDSWLLFYLVAWTGLRQSEALALQWQDFDGEFLKIQRAFKGNNGDNIGPPKWGKTRTAYVMPEIQKKLVEHKLQSEFSGDTDWIFCWPDGKRYGQNWWRKSFLRAMENSEIDAEARNLSPHSFRHSLNTNALEVGIPAEIVRIWMGWTSDKVQMAHYSHMTNEMVKTAMQKIKQA